MLTLAELEVLDRINEVWDAFAKLPSKYEEGGHHEDQADFRYHMHRLQDLIASRSAYRDLRQRNKKVA